MSTEPLRAQSPPPASAAELTDLQYTQTPRLPERLAARLSSTAIRLLGELRWAARRGTVAEVSDETLGRQLGRSEQTVQRLLLALENQGLIARLRRRGRRTITLVFRLTGPSREGSQTVHPPLIPGQPSEAPQTAPQAVHALLKNEECIPQKRGVHSSKMRGSPDPSLFRTETTSSSESSESKSDDDESAAPSGEKTKTADPDGRTTALAFAAAHLPTALADQLAADADRTAAKTDGRWDCVTAAIAMAALRIRRPGPPLKSPLAWITRCAQDYVRCGISVEAKDAREKLEAQARTNAAAAARVREQEARDQEQQNRPITAEDLAQWRAWVAERGPLARLAEKLLAEAEAGEKAPAPGGPLARTREPAERDCAVPDRNDCSTAGDNRQGTGSRVNHRLH
jgi:hypothetical protein